MVDEHDVRAIAMTLAGTAEVPGSMDFRVDSKGFAWPYLERVHPKRARIERRDIIVVRTGSEDEKLAMIATESDKFFTTDHYNGYPAVMVRLAAIDIDELSELLVDAHAVASQLKKRAKRSPSR